MAIITRYRHGVPNWTDVAVADLGRATDFYTGLFGWDSHDMGEEAGHYTLLSLDGRAVAALGPKQGGDEGMPLWTTYVSVDDLDAALAKVDSAGGSIVAPRVDVFTAGSMASVADATGAVVHLWQPGDRIGAEVVNVANTPCWNELNTRDVEATTAFYRDVVGWQIEEMDAGDAEGGGLPGYRLVKVGDRVVAGVLPMEGDDWGDLPSHWMAYFCVDDAHATASTVSDLGGSVPVEPFEMPLGTLSVCNDPEGNAFSVIAFSGPVDDVPDGVA